MPAILPHRRRIVVPSFVGLLLVSALASADQPPPPSDDSGVLRIDVLQIQKRQRPNRVFAVQQTGRLSERLQEGAAIHVRQAEGQK
ncbi:MAG: hypothetical protein AAF997_10920, partial [Myxococcota bacterium]